MHQAEEMPRNMRARAEAVLKKVQATRKSGKKNREQTWLDIIFERQGSLAHKIFDSPNRFRQEKIAEDGTINQDSHLRDQFNKFKELWNGNSEGSSEGYARAYLCLRDKLMHQIADGAAPSLKLLHQWLSPENLQAQLQQYKPNTSTGSCHVKLGDLKSCPQEVSTSLSEVLVEAAW